MRPPGGKIVYRLLLLVRVFNDYNGDTVFIKYETSPFVGANPIRFPGIILPTVLLDYISKLNFPLVRIINQVGKFLESVASVVEEVLCRVFHKAINFISQR